MARKFIPLHKPAIATHVRGATHGRQAPLRVVLHDTESHDAAGITDVAGVFRFWVDQGLGYNVHFIVDGDGNIGQGARVKDLCWHVGGLNTGSVGIEQIGYASYGKLIWSRKRREQLRSVAKLLAWLHVEFDIPLSVPADVNYGSRGVLTHAKVSAVYAASGGHTDPGAGYPLRYVLWLARRFVSHGGWYVRV